MKFTKFDLTLYLVFVLSLIGAVCFVFFPYTITLQLIGKIAVWAALFCCLAAIWLLRIRNERG